MAEALAITATVATVSQIVAYAITLSTKTYQAIDGIDEAPRHIRTLASDLRAFYSILGTIEFNLQDTELAGGFLHPTTSQDLTTVLHNCVSIFKEFHELVQGYLKVSRTSTVSRWQILRWTWKENEVKTLRDNLAAHKITLNVAIAAANFINSRDLRAGTKEIGESTGRIEEDVQELKTQLRELLQRLPPLQEALMDSRVVSWNYRDTIERYVQDTDSIIMAGVLTLRERQTPAVSLSLLVSTLHSASTYMTAPTSPDSVVEINGASVLIVAASTDNPLPKCRQIFVRGLTKHTIVINEGLVIIPSYGPETSTTGEHNIDMSFIYTRLCQESRIPESRILLAYGGRVLSQYAVETLPHDATLPASLRVHGHGHSHWTELPWSN